MTTATKLPLVGVTRTGRGVLNLQLEHYLKEEEILREFTEKVQETNPFVQAGVDLKGGDWQLATDEHGNRILLPFRRPNGT